MPITASAKKALRQSTRRKAQNLRSKNTYKNTLKELKSLAATGKKDEVKKLLPKVYKSLDKAAKTNVISKNKSARLKSFAAKLLQKTA
ncbi:MAG: 30S ribosomal protein S20 [Candidatus Yanofskybacteria bacterium RIFCSPHIGHO2_01_FULL_42_12]|uniref:Small ribosomal subunit protein bS20 n=1 Tax=Candidatus Yanofskybacteria bacterium RIFCSPLOWO2_01_FULL_42_49 TaxID=1802694 RepID=A0A1F8GA30_9BACT|nr:MAG: 30S ribosomal protein S20 [Candidatus Yanofskybacteria bacterium RIFCSPHIGHO2_01_FULL_42_12]OGN22225.1 MAG: 30S ribosomal protein S20 [Candidatus Yanofskybacteria bacterium RIFCSPLOWO2_01_FULL_42_49]